MVQLAFQPDDAEAVVAVSADSSVTCWDLTRSAEVQTWAPHARAVCCVHWAALTPGRLVTASADRAIVVNDLRVAKPVVVLKGPSGAVQVPWGGRGICGVFGGLAALFGAEGWR